MKKLIRKILKEDLDYWGVSDASPENDEYHMSPLNEDMDEMDDSRQMFLNRIIEVMKNDYPLFKNMKLYGFYDQLSYDELIYVLKGIIGKGLVYGFELQYGFVTYRVFNKNNDSVYIEFYDGDWDIPKYD